MHTQTGNENVIKQKMKLGDIVVDTIQHFESVRHFNFLKHDRVVCLESATTMQKVKFNG